GAGGAVGHLRGRDQRQRLRGRGRRPRVRHHERGQAVRVRPGLPGARPRGGPPAGRGQRPREGPRPPGAAPNPRNRGIANLLQSYGRLWRHPAEAVELYTRQSSLRVTVTELAVMGATLADGGLNPLTRERVVDAAVCHFTLAVMTTAGDVRGLGRLAVRRGRAGQ